MDINKIITIVLGVFLFTAIIGPLADQVSLVGTNAGGNATNVTGGSLVIIGLTVLVLAIGFLVSIVRMAGIGKGGRK